MKKIYILKGINYIFNRNNVLFWKNYIKNYTATGLLPLCLHPPTAQSRSHCILCLQTTEKLTVARLTKAPRCLFLSQKKGRLMVKIANSIANGLKNIYLLCHPPQVVNRCVYCATKRFPWLRNTMWRGTTTQITARLLPLIPRARRNGEKNYRCCKHRLNGVKWHLVSFARNNREPW